MARVKEGRGEEQAGMERPWAWWLWRWVFSEVLVVSSQAMCWTCPLPYTGRVRALEIRPGPMAGPCWGLFSTVVPCRMARIPWGQQSQCLTVFLVCPHPRVPSPACSARLCPPPALRQLCWASDGSERGACWWEAARATSWRKSSPPRSMPLLNSHEPLGIFPPSQHYRRFQGAQCPRQLHPSLQVKGSQEAACLSSKPAAPVFRDPIRIICWELESSKGDLHLHWPTCQVGSLESNSMSQVEALPYTLLSTSKQVSAPT